MVEDKNKYKREYQRRQKNNNREESLKYINVVRKLKCKQKKQPTAKIGEVTLIIY